MIRIRHLGKSTLHLIQGGRTHTCRSNYFVLHLETLHQNTNIVLSCVHTFVCVLHCNTAALPILGSFRSCNNNLLYDGNQWQPNSLPSSSDSTTSFWRRGRHIWKRCTWYYHAVLAHVVVVDRKLPNTRWGWPYLSSMYKVLKQVLWLSACWLDCLQSMGCSPYFFCIEVSFQKTKYQITCAQDLPRCQDTILLDIVIQ